MYCAVAPCLGSHIRKLSHELIVHIDLGKNVGITIKPCLGSTLIVMHWGVGMFNELTYIIIIPRMAYYIKICQAFVKMFRPHS